ncbi:hypothetical protein [Shewanella nanhaiensis]|uniref:Uncharacterized protein n=1 Tax=Shewanella nanhaiensis TaxID=2864872 RepID=A0ABS7DZ92_9GAMM|nr:hypothetical protein [Shewanella nanhaiensis]MBW8182738.1 hypothetical protein [Shewanella nanhaiensis]
MLIAVFIVTVASCCKQPEIQLYNNPEIGLKMSYNSSWKSLNDSTLREALVLAEKQMTIPHEAAGYVRDFIPLTLLRLAKSQEFDGIAHNSIIHVIATPIRKGSRGIVDRLIEEQVTELRLTFPDVITINNALPMPEYPLINNFLSIQLKDKRVFSQYQYAYWYPPYLVQIALSFSHSDDEQELKKIINSLKIDI